MIKAKRFLAALLLLLAVALSQLAAQAQTFSVLYNFGTNPGDPLWIGEIGAIAQGRDGNLYSTSPSGGTYGNRVPGLNNQGTVFKITLDGKLTVLYNFDVTHGAGPRGGLTLGKDGNFYGTTYSGGKYGAGTIFKITPQGQLTTLWDFRNGKVVPSPVYPRQPTEQEKLDAAGSYPISAPVQATDGNFYGVTSYANNQQYGVLYRITPGGAYQGLYFFKGDKGRFPSSLMAAKDGTLYGLTAKGDATCPYGTVFKASRSGGVATLHTFQLATGSWSQNLMQAGDGNLYGTASTGGKGAGVVYKLTPTGEYTVLHAFTGLADGSTPVGGVAQGADGNLYGTTKFGATGRSRGVIYRISPKGENFAVVYNFPPNWSNGRLCVTTPFLHTNGKFYGTTYQGGSKNSGVFYSLDVGGCDPQLSDAEVKRWFTGLARGDGGMCEVRGGNDVTALVDGRETFSSMAQAIRTANGPNHFVYLLGWWQTDSFPLSGANTTLIQLLTEASQKNVQVRAMLWDQPGTQNNVEVAHINALGNGAAAILDDRTLNLGSHHQKILVVNGSQGLIAFCGGADINPDRVEARGAGAPLHDVHCRITGPAAADLLTIFVQRWQDHPNARGVSGLDTRRGALRGLNTPVPAAVANATNWVQVGRTFGNGTDRAGLLAGPYRFAPNGEQSAARMIVHAISQAKKFIYIEDQYFVDTDSSKLGLGVRQALVNKLRDPDFKHLTILIPHGSITEMGPFRFNQVNYRRKRLIDALKAAGSDRVRVYYLKPEGGQHTYVHSKTWIFDDQFAIIGSANTNRRSWTHDSEVVAGICDQGVPDASRCYFPHRLRMQLWAEHLNLLGTRYEERLKDGVASASLWLAPPPGARIASYDTIVPEINPSQDAWDNAIDPDGT